MKISLYDINPEKRLSSLLWLVSEYGDSSENTWYLDSLNHVIFFNEKNAIIYLLKWS